MAHLHRLPIPPQEEIPEIFEQDLIGSGTVDAICTSLASCPYRPEPTASSRFRHPDVRGNARSRLLAGTSGLARPQPQKTGRAARSSLPLFFVRQRQ